jgi:GNAT superfamily N-acetyltransferase
MPTLKIYPSNNELPSEYECQIRAFIRMLWHDAYAYDLAAPLAPPERHPQHVVMAEQHALLSYARVNWVNITHVGESYRMYCLGDVFTYPAFRKRGYGSQIVEAATSIMRADAQGDAAILFTEPNLEKFYAQSGWQHIAGLTSNIGDAAQPEAHNYFAMMLFLSRKAQQRRADFATQTLLLPGYGW